MLGALIAYPFVLVGKRPAYAIALLVLSTAVFAGLDAAIAELGYDVIYDDITGTSASRLYFLLTNIINVFVAGLGMALALQHLGRRVQGPSLRDGIALWAISIWYGVAVLLPFAVLALIIVGGLSAFAPEPYRMAAAIGAGCILAVPLIYVSLRLSFAGPRTLVDERVHLFRTWPLTRGKAWLILGLSVAAFAVSFLIAMVPSLITFYAPPPEPLIGWRDALAPWAAFNILVTEFCFVLATFYFGAAQCFMFDRLAVETAPG